MRNAPPLSLVFCVSLTRRRKQAELRSQSFLAWREALGAEFHSIRQSHGKVSFVSAVACCPRCPMNLGEGGGRTGFGLPELAHPLTRLCGAVGKGREKEPGHGHCHEGA